MSTRSDPGIRTFTAAERSAVLAQYVAAAEHGMPCPSFERIRGVAGVSVHKARCITDALHADGTIIAEKRAGGRRMVAVVATGKSTIPSDTGRYRRDGTRTEFAGFSGDVGPEQEGADRIFRGVFADQNVALASGPIVHISRPATIVPSRVEGMW